MEYKNENKAGLENTKEINLKDVEHILLSHSGVLNATVKIHQDGEKKLIEAHVKLKKGHIASDELKSELAWHVTTDLGSNIVFKDIHLETEPTKPSIPKTESKPLITGGIYISGHKIDPQEIQHIMESHEDVDSAIITGVPDDRKGEVLKASISLRDGCTPSDELKEELAWYVQSNIGHVVTFRDIIFQGEDEPEDIQDECMVIVDGIEKDGDEVHISSHKISTTEITKVLLSHPDISDAAVVSVPDDKAGETMKAFVRLKDGVIPSNDLKLELAWFITTELKPISVFKNIELGAHIPELPLEDVIMDTGELDSVDISGFRILSDDVEDVLRRHDRVSDVVVIGVPDPVHGEALDAFVSLIEGAIPSPELKEELAWHARAEIGSEVVFKSIKFRKFLPKTGNKKILRSIVKADALDLSANMSITIAD